MGNLPIIRPREQRHFAQQQRRLTAHLFGGKAAADFFHAGYGCDLLQFANISPRRNREPPGRVPLGVRKLRQTTSPPHLAAPSAKLDYRSERP